MEKVLFLKKQAQKIYRKGGMEILLVSYPEIEGETPIAQHCRALVEALCAYAEGEPHQIAIKALSEAIAAKKLFAFSRHSFYITLDTVLEKAGVVCTLSISFTCGTSLIFKRELQLFWDKDGQIQKRRLRHRARSATH